MRYQQAYALTGSFGSRGTRTISSDRLEPEELSGAVTLVVIDMQPGWQASNNQLTLAAVCRQVELAISRGWPIVLLEVNPAERGATHEPIRALLKGYARVSTRVKKGACGANQVLQACLQSGYTTDAFRVCGVNTEACVRATVVGLQARLPDSIIRVIRQACNTDDYYGFAPGEEWEGFPAAPQVQNVVVSEESVGPSPVSNLQAH